MSAKGSKWQYIRLPGSTFWTRIRLCLAGAIMIILFVCWAYQGPGKYPMPENEKRFPVFTNTLMKSLGAKLDCDAKIIVPSKSAPTNVNKVRPADIKVLGALGDSITVASGSKNYYEDAKWDIFVGNSLFIGGDESISTLATLGNILKSINPQLVGLSHGQGEADRGFNVAVGGMTANDLPRQAEELVLKIKSSPSVNIDKDWKLITIFIGTNDIGRLNCYNNKSIVTYSTYKTQIENAIGILQKGLPRTIVSILAIWNPQLTIEAKSIIFEGKRKECGEGTVERRDSLINSYRKAAYELQDEQKFNTDNFTVVTQGFLDDIKDSFRNSFGAYDTSFYADDIFHLSKYGNAIFGKFFWNGLLEPVGKKTKKADINNDNAPLICPNKDMPFIRTLGNS